MYAIFKYVKMKVKKVKQIPVELPKMYDNKLHKFVDDDTIENDIWLSKLKDGKLLIDDKERWGRFEIRSEYAYTRYADFWYFEASDVSRVDLSNKGRQFDPCITPKEKKVNKIKNNELLYAMHFAPEMSLGLTIKDYRKMIEEGKFGPGMYATMAGKAENTKFGKKTRETYSADDLSREILSE